MSLPPLKIWVCYFTSCSKKPGKTSLFFLRVLKTYYHQLFATSQKTPYRFYSPSIALTWRLRRKLPVQSQTALRLTLVSSIGTRIATNQKQKPGKMSLFVFKGPDNIILTTLCYIPKDTL